MFSPDSSAPTDLVALVDAVDELRVRGRPREADRRRVDRLGLHVAGGDGGHWEGQAEVGRGRRRKKQGVRTRSSGLLEVRRHLFGCRYRSPLHRSGQIPSSRSF